MGGYSLASVRAAVVIALIGAWAVDSRGQEPAAEASGPAAVAVLDFHVIGEAVDPAIGEALPAVIRSALVRSCPPEQIRLIERAELAAILKEQDLQLTDIVDPASAVEVGRIAGVDQLVLGSVAGVGRTYTVTSRVVDVTTGEAAGAEEFVLQTLDDYPQLGRLIAALVGEQPIGEDCVAAAATVSESFNGKTCRLTVDSTKNPANGTTLENGRYVMNKASRGSHYWWVPGVEDNFYLQVDLAQLEGPPNGGYGVVWGAKGTGDYLSVLLSGQQDVRIERRQGGTTSTPLVRNANWPIINQPPRSNRVRIESWEDRHRVFVNGVCVDDFYEPGYRGGKVGLRVHSPNGETPARYAADNLVAGVLDLSAAGIAADEDEPEPATDTDKDERRRPRVLPRMRQKDKPIIRSSSPEAKINRVWVTPDRVRDKDGVQVHVDFAAHNLKGDRLLVEAFFVDVDAGATLKDRDGQYRNGEGVVTASRLIAPRYRVSSYSDLSLFIPRDQLHLPPGRSRLRCYVTIWDESQNPPRKVARSEAVPFALKR